MNINELKTVNTAALMRLAKYLKLTDVEFEYFVIKTGDT